MVHKTRSWKKINVDKANGNGSSSSGMGKMDRLGLRKSAQEIPSRTSKSKLLEKQPPPTPCTQIKSRRPEKLNTLSPLRTPDRDKSHILYEEELNLSATKKEKSVKQVTMESEKVSTSGNQNICLKRKRIDGRSFRSLFKMQRRRDAMPAIDEVSQIPNESPRLSSDSKLVGDKVIGGGDCHREVAEEYSEDHAAQADEVDSLSSSEGLNTGNLHTDGEAELSHANHIHILASEPIVALPEGDSLKGSINGCTISKTLDETESLPEGCSTATKNLPDLIGSTPTSGGFNSQNGEHSIQRKSADRQIVCGLVCATTQSTLVKHDKHCFTWSCGVCLKQKRLDHDSPKVDLCTCVAMPKMDFGNIANHKDRVGVESTVIMGSAERHCAGQSGGANMDSQVDNHKNVCAVCKQGGKSLLCYGEGCRRCYHLSCLGPNLDDIPSGVWHCLWCVKKKIKYGVHSVSKGIESIWDAREVEEVSGTQRQKQYLVKYQGLAHVHNHWLPEAQLVIEAPSILEDFKHKDPGLRWNSEWTKPQCLLKKRLLFFSKLHGGEQILDAGDKLDCQCEWLVMWQGLDVESATWELGNADFLCSSHGLSLIKEYEICQGKQNMMFSQLTASDNRLELSKFIEYWLPVQVSNLQLEQYCNTLLANINALCSHSKKSDPVGVLNEVLLAVRKCCVHPYILDQTVLPLNKGLSPSEILDFGIKASGKLHLLDKMLSEMKSQHLRVVIFYQSIGPVALLGNILDDFMRGRFGAGSFECVETSLSTSKRQAALNGFRKQETGQFVLLLEKRICNTSIKLSSVDGVIIYDGDSNPQNDLRLLQKLSFVSQSKPIRVFRLYSCYTVEEQVLVITKQNPNADNLQSLNRNVKNTLMWGASHLFSRLEEYHASDSQASALDISCGQLLLNDVVKEFCAIISQNSEIDDIHNSVISKVLKSSGPCITDIPLFGEQKFKYTCGEEPQVFWKKLLEGRNPQWRHISGPTPRNRKRVQYFEDSPCSPEVGNDDAGKKRRKTVNSSVDAISTLPVSESSQPAALNDGPTIKAANQSLPTSTACQNSAHIGDHAFNSSCSLSHEVNVEPVERVALPDEQKSLHIYLKAEMAKVFEVLKLSDDIKHMVGIFLDFIMENHRVSREPATLLQALEISLCRVAASLLKQKLDENEMLMLTKEHLGFECTEDEATNVHRKLRSLKKAFLQHLEKNEITSRHSEPALVSVTGGLSKGVENVTKENVVAEQTTTLKDIVVESETEKMIKKVQSKCDMRMSRLKEKQQEEIENFKKDCEEKRVAIEKHYRVQFAIVRAVHCETPLAKNNLKNLNNRFSREIEELNCHKDLKMKEFEQKHKEEINEEIQNTAFWVSKAELCSTEDAVTNLHLYASDSRDDVEYLQDSVDTGNNISDSGDGTGDQDIADIDNNSISNSREDNGNLQDIEDDNREMSDSRDDVRNLQDIADVNDNPTNVASRDDICNLEDNVDINNHNNNKSNSANVASADDIGHSQDNADVNDPPGVASVSECHLEANEPINILNESESSMAPSSVPTTTTDEVQSKDVLSATVSEKPMATISPAEALVSSLNQPNNVGNIDDHCEDTVPVVPLTSEKHPIDESSLGEHANGFSIEVHECARTEDVIHNHPSEVRGIAHNGVLRHEHPAGASITTMVKNCTPANNTDFLNNDGNENDIAHKSIDGNSTSQEQLLVALPSLQAGACSDDNGLLLQTQDRVPQDQCSPHLASNELQFNQGQLSEFEAGSPRVDDARRVTQANCESILIGNSEPQQLPSGGNQPPPGEAAYESPNHGSNDLHCSETSPQLAEVETAAEPLCNADSQGRVSSELHASVHLPNMTLDCSPTDSSVSRIDCQPSGELHCSSENTQTLPHEVRITSELPNQAILQPLNLTSIQGPNDMRMHHAHFMPSLNSPIRMLVNPLSKELERIHKEIEQAVKSHEDWKLQQRSDCEKEIKEMIERIRNKFETKILEGENAFFLRKNELEGNQNKVLMNRILAEAFRSKCLDPRPTVLPSQMQQAVPSSYMQQQQHLQHASMQQPTLRSPVGLSSAGQQTPNPACMSMRPPQSIAGNLRLAGDIRAPAPHLHQFRPTSVSAASPSPLPTAMLGCNVAANMPSSSPSFAHVAPQQLTPSPSLPRVAPQVQIPSHHVPRVAPQMQMPSQSLPRVEPQHQTPSQSVPRVAPQHQTPSQSVPRVAPQHQAPSSSRPWVAPQPQTPSSSHPRVAPSPSLPRVAPQSQTLSSSLPRVAPQQPQVVSSNLSHQKVPAPPQLQPTTVNKNSEPNNRVVTTGNSPLSALLLRDLDNQPFANQRNDLPPLPEICTTFDSIDLSDFGTTGNAAGTSAAEPNAGADVVCLSDDD
ncbi:PREDICTED: helicase protein MOM1-like isoform X2 [Ipomoea nil]|uniref:helicase protein MOM1-like isoform X2 n=1 Tax=Ipomoea nil TaxID=35883 RepID=UPI0009019355|nr:PREDICTED: helicase protein MOM1-like isoform X2 [Ipomoea nil]